MTYEQPAVNETEAAYVNPAAIQEIKDEFAGGALLYSDALNVWPFQTSVESFDELEPVLHYEEYFKNKAEKSVKILTENNLYSQEEITQAAAKNYQERALIMQLSSSEKVAAFDALVDEFNVALERIKNDKDVTRFKEFINRAAYLVRMKKTGAK